MYLDTYIDNIYYIERHICIVIHVELTRLKNHEELLRIKKLD